MHYWLTVFVDAEAAATRETRNARIAEMMAPFDEAIEMPPYKVDCWKVSFAERFPEADIDAHDDLCCGGTLKETATYNRRAKWDYYLVDGSGGSRCEGTEPDRADFALLGPEGWQDQADFYGRMLGRGESRDEWIEVFQKVFAVHEAHGLVPVIIDYHR